MEAQRFVSSSARRANDDDVRLGLEAVQAWGATHMKSNSAHADAYLGGGSGLVVDDYEPLRAVVATMLKCRGAAVTAVGSADEALEALQREHPDVLVSDLVMPDKGGYWLIGQVRALPAERGGITPAAALTAFTGPEHRASVLRAGFQVHVEKPIGLDALIGVVATLAPKERAV